jgi:Ca2+-binding EF-hand superfamily protein
MSAAKTAQLQGLFNEIDLNHEYVKSAIRVSSLTCRSGKIDFTELSVYDFLNVFGEGFLTSFSAMKKSRFNFNDRVIRRMIQHLDAGQRGGVSFEEFAQLTRFLEFMRESFAREDQDKNGKVIATYTGAGLGYFRQPQHLSICLFFSLPELIDPLLRIFDILRFLQIDKAEFGRALIDMGFNLKPSSLDHLFSVVDTDKSGTIEFEEYVDLRSVATYSTCSL